MSAVHFFKIPRNPRIEKFCILFIPFFLKDKLFLQMLYTVHYWVTTVWLFHSSLLFLATSLLYPQYARPRIFFYSYRRHTLSFVYIFLYNHPNTKKTTGFLKSSLVFHVDIQHYICKSFNVPSSKYTFMGVFCLILRFCQREADTENPLSQEGLLSGSCLFLADSLGIVNFETIIGSSTH